MAGFRIVTAPIAHPTPKRPRAKADGHLAFIRSLPCLVTGSRPVEAAHVRYADARFAKRAVGMAEKPDDCWTVPLNPMAHREQHAFNERLWWRHWGIDPLVVALALWRATGDQQAGEQIIALVRRTPTLKSQGAADGGE